MNMLLQPCLPEIPPIEHQLVNNNDNDHEKTAAYTRVLKIQITVVNIYVQDIDENKQTQKEYSQRM